MPDCPSDAELAGFLNEAIAPDRAVELATHVDNCVACQERLGRLTLETEKSISRYSQSFPQAVSSIEEPRTTDGSPSFTEARTLMMGGPTPLNIPYPSTHVPVLPHVPGFEILAEIGRGGMGVVYKARHRRLNRLVALKMILAGAAADARTVQRFLFEAEILARIQHPQIVQVFEVETFQGPGGVPIPYLAIELLEGGSLSRRLKNGVLEPRAAAELMEGIARAVHAVHVQGVIHRDLKPGNILFPEPGVGSRESGDWWQVTGDSRQEKGDGEDGRTRSASSLSSVSGLLTPKVADFGLAKFTEAGADLTASGQVVGTPHYMAPEQAAGNKRIGPEADVYSLGAILFECLTGRPPFEGGEPMSVLVKVVTDRPPDVRGLRPEVSRDLGAVVMRCLEKDPRRRYASAEELANDLRRHLDNRPTKARPVSARERAWLWARRNPAVAGLLAALIAVMAIGFFAVTWLWIEERETARRERNAREQAELAEAGAKDAHGLTTKALNLAKISEGLAVDARKKQTEALALLEFERAMEWCEEGRIRQGLDLFVHTVELAESTGAHDLARVARTNLAAWPRELPGPRRAFAHDKQPRLAAFHPDGKHMVTAGRGSAVHLWDTVRGSRVRTYKPAIAKPLYRITGVTYWTVAVSPDGGTIAAGSSDGYITIWNTDSPDARFSFDGIGSVSGTDGNIWAVAFAPDGTLWANDGQSGLKHWRVSGKKPELVAHAKLPPATWASILQVLVISPDGSRLYSGDRTGNIREWDAEKAVELRRWSAGGWVQDLALSADGTRVAATGPEGVARIIDLPANRVSLDINLASAYGNGIAFAPRKPYLFTSDGDGNVRMWHSDTGMPIGAPIRFSGEVTKIRFRPNSDEFAVPAGDSVFLCSIPDPPYDVIVAGRGRRIRGLDLSADGRWIAVSDDDRFETYDALTFRRVQRVNYTRGWPYYRLQDQPLTIRFDPDPSRVRVFRGLRGGVDHLAVPDGSIARTIPSFRLDNVDCIDFLHDGAEILVADSNSVSRWDAAKLRHPAVGIIEKLPVGVEVKVLAARPDSGEVLVGFAKQLIFLNPETLKPSRPGWQAGDEVLDAKYTPDGTKVLIGRRDNMAELLDARDGSPICPPLPHAKAVLAVAVSPDGKVLLTGSRDGVARFWDAATGLPLGAPLRHFGPVTHVVFARDGDHAVTGTGTGHVLLWDVPPPPAKGTLEELRTVFEKKG